MAVNDDPTLKEIDRLGIEPDYPPEKIRGVGLTPGQYDMFVRLSGKLAKAQVDKFVVSPEWGTLDDDGKRGHILSAIMNAREAASNTVMTHSLGGSNDIVKQAVSAKLARQAAQTTSP